MLTKNKFSCYKDLANSSFIYSPSGDELIPLLELLYGNRNNIPVCTNGTLKVISYRKWHDSRIYYSDYKDYLHRQSFGFEKRSTDEPKWKKELNEALNSIALPSFVFDNKEVVVKREKDIYNFFKDEIIPKSAKHNKRKKSEKMKGIKILERFDKVAKQAKKDLRTYKKKRKDIEQKFLNERNAKNLARSLRRTRQSIKYYANCIEADHLITLTFRGVVTDREYVKNCFQRFFRYLRTGFNVKSRIGETIGKRNGTKKIFDYIAVLEKHKSGGYHIHVAVKGRKEIGRLRDAWYKAIGGFGDDKGDQTKGQINITHIKEKNTANTVANYLSKYISKSIMEEGTNPLFKRRFWRSYSCDKGENKPEINYHCVYKSKEINDYENIVTYLENAFDLVKQNYKFNNFDVFQARPYIAEMNARKIIDEKEEQGIYLSEEDQEKIKRECLREFPFIFDYIDLRLYKKVEF